jgi:predicted HAD superfamily hydrolase
MVEICKKNLNDVAQSFGLINVQWSVFYQNGLYINEKFDFVVGSAYISYLNLDVSIREKTKNDFVSCAVANSIIYMLL